jgi:hypothetical protein
MLSSRLVHDRLASARLSHAIRLNTSEENWLFVSSANLDELAQHTLPGIRQQLQYLVQWLASQLGDDSLGRTPYPSPEILAAIVGAVDGERVERLIDHAEKENLIVRDRENGVMGLTPAGWSILEPQNATPPSESPQAPTDEQKKNKTVKAHCNNCGGERNAHIRASYTVSNHDNETSWSDTYDILECLGCNNLSVRHTFWFSEWDQFDTDPQTGHPRLLPGTKEAYWPPQTTRRKPVWVENLSDDVLRRVIDEVYGALNHGQIVLASIGLRTLLDRAMFLRLGDGVGGFTARLKLMVEKGHIGNDEREILEIITDAGNAAAHRGFAPSYNALGTIAEAVESLLHREFVLKTAAGEVKEETPKRPSLKHKT